MTSSLFPERHLRHIWQHRLFTQAPLYTSDGRRVVIISPGRPNNDEGPDFVEAVLRIGNTNYRGDVEIHTDLSDWRRHGHGTDPHYNRVILHVVLTLDSLIPLARTASKRILPLLVLHPFLDRELVRLWMDGFVNDTEPRCCALPCARLNDQVPGDIIVRWLERLGAERIEIKVRRCEERLKELIDERTLTLREPYPRYCGNPDDIPLPRKEYTQRDLAAREPWEQLLYEGVMEGLGYAKNRTPFRALAQSLRLSTLREYSLTDTITLMALLFGSSGLLPSSRGLPEKESRRYVRMLRQRWQTLRPAATWPLLHEGDWLFFRLRPANFPTARLAASCFLIPRLFHENGFKNLIYLFKDEEISCQARILKLRELLTIKPEGFWQTHLHFRGCAGTQGSAVGSSRIHELLVNVILPVALLYGRIFHDLQVRQHARKILTSLSSPPNNGITRAVQRELTRHRMKLFTALQHQGAIQLYKSYCLKGACGECEVGRRVGLNTPLQR